MKGFFSFILLFSLILLIVQSISYFSHSFSPDELIEIERIYDSEMNLKELMFEGSKEGSLDGLSIYLLSNPEQEFNTEDAKHYVQVAVHEKLSLINSLEFEDFEFKIWCGNPSKKSLDSLRKDMISENQLLLCNNCNGLEYLNCLDYITPEFLLDVNPGEIPQLYSLTLGNEEGSFGISIYSEKFRISSVFLIPKKEVLLIE